MIQIVALRESKNGRKHHVFTSRDYGIFFESLEHLIMEREKIVAAARQNNDDYNLYFTVADCHDGDKPRIFKEQWYVPFDIDGITWRSDTDQEIKEQATAIVNTACSALNLDPLKTFSLFSGNGVQFFVKLPAPFTYQEYFEEHREGYYRLCQVIQNRLDYSGLTGRLDTSVFSSGRLMRLPDTWNVKPDKPRRKSYVLQPNIEAQELVMERTELATFKNGDLLVKYPDPDSDYVENECVFLVWNKNNPNSVSEAAWYADLSIRGRLEGGVERVHEASSGYKGYDFDETEMKLEQALKTAGPRTCKNINTISDACNTCIHKGKVVSPITLRGPDYIKSKATGFRQIKVKDGVEVPGPVDYDGLIKQFSIDYSYRVEETSLEIYVWSSTHWIPFSEGSLMSWAYSKVHSPTASAKEMKEFTARVRCLNQTSIDFFEEQKGWLNFSNGTYSVKDRKLYRHNQEFGMTYVLPHPYDETAQSPLWDAFVLKIMDGDKQLVDVLESYLGYSISGDNCWLQKAIFLVGEGANGKSTLIETIKHIVGRKNTTSVPVQKIHVDTYRQRLHLKLFNFSEETSVDSLIDNSEFKNLVSGGSMIVKELYKQPKEVVNTCKFIIACNELPRVKDSTYAMSRRMIIVPFEHTFKEEERKRDYHLELVKEASGIFNRLIEAYYSTINNGYIKETAAIKKHVEEYRIENSSVLMFLREETYFEPGKQLDKSVLYSEYSTYCIVSGMRPKNKVWFYRELYSVYGRDGAVVLKRDPQSRIEYIYGLGLNKSMKREEY